MGANEAKYRAAEDRYWAFEGVRPTEQWLSLPRVGSRVRVLIVGDGPPVVFVHGVNTGATSWAPLASRLTGFRCVLLDRPGCGLSEPIPRRVDTPERFATYAETLIVDVLDALELPSAHILGTSLGGYHTLRTAAAHPERLVRIVVMGWSVGAPSGDMPFVMRLGGVRPIASLMAAIPVNDRATRALLGRIGLKQALAAGRVPPEGVAWFKAMVNDTATMRNDIDTVPPIMHPRHGLSDAILFTDDVLQRIDVPVRFIWGADDLFGGAEVAKAFVSRVPGAELEIVPGGHAVWMDDPDAIAATTAQFLDGARRE